MYSGAWAAVSAVFLVASFGSAPRAEPPSPAVGNFWLTPCTSDLKHYQSYCAWYIGGYVEGREAGRAHQHLMEDASAKLVEDLYCLPNGVTYDQLRLVVAAHMKSNPQQLHHAFGAIISAALTKAFPCQAK